MTFKEDLLEGKKRVGIWGLGYIGYSSMANFASRGVSCIGTDVLRDVVDNVNSARIAIPNMEYWLGFDVGQLSHLMKATRDWKELISEDIPVHLICIPTEKGGEPYNDILVDIITKLCTYTRTKTRPLFIIESTVTPTTVDQIVIPLLEKNGLAVGKDILLGVAPRRDWFVSPEKSLKTLPRVVGGTTPETTELMADILGIVCDTILKATDHKHAALVKSIENAYRQVEITLANELSCAYPHINMTEVLKLVGTKWNIGTYHPSFGTGGYCIPLAPKYVLMGAEKPEALNIIKASIKSDENMPDRVVKSLIRRNAKRVGILGLAYKGDLKVDILSPTLRIVNGLQRAGIDVRVNDPYYTSEEIRQIAGCKSFEFPQGLSQFDTILIVADHRKYSFTQKTQIRDNLQGVRLILDNVGIWRNLRLECEYHEAGDKNWLG